MKKLIVIFILIAQASFAQDSLSYWSAGITSGIDLNYRRTTAIDSITQLKTDADNLESSQWGYTAGLRIGRSVHKRVSIMSGIQLISRGYAIDTLQAAALTNMQYRYRLLEVPLYAEWSLSDKKVRPIFLAGCSVRQLIDEQITYERIGINAQYSLVSQNMLTKIGFNVMAGLGVQIPFYQTWKLNIQCQLNQSITSVSSTDLKRYLNSAGIWFDVLKTF